MERLLHQYFRVLARYNTWANARIYDACTCLDEDAYRRPRTPSGPTAHSLLNVRLATDRVWASRLRGYLADERTIGQELHVSLDALRQAQLAEDVELVEYVDSLAEEDLLRPTAFQTGIGEHHSNAQYEILTHLFADQTGWRGKMSLLLPAPPDVDMLTFFSDTEVGQRPLHP